MPLATTYYMALFLDCLLQMCRYEIIESSNRFTGHTPKRPFKFPKLDSTQAIHRARFREIFGRFDFEEKADPVEKVQVPDLEHRIKFQEQVDLVTPLLKPF